LHKTSNFYAKEYEDKESLSCFLEEIFVIGRFCLYYVGTDILVCWKENIIKTLSFNEETKHNNQLYDQTTLEEKQLKYTHL
jgi:hypothetical protein